MQCPACKEECESFSTSFSKEGIWCNHAGWVLVTGAKRGDPPILEMGRDFNFVEDDR